MGVRMCLWVCRGVITYADGHRVHVLGFEFYGYVTVKCVGMVVEYIIKYQFYALKNILLYYKQHRLLITYSF